MQQIFYRYLDEIPEDLQESFDTIEAYYKIFQEEYEKDNKLVKEFRMKQVKNK